MVFYKLPRLLPNMKELNDPKYRYEPKDWFKGKMTQMTKNESLYKLYAHTYSNEGPCL